MIEWLNAISGTLTGITTFILVLITLWYIHLTRQLLKTTYRPEIVIYLRASSVPRPIRSLAYVTQFCVKNVGVGLARRVRFGGDLQIENPILRNGSLLTGVDFLSEGIDALAPGEERTCQSSYEESDEQEKLRLVVTVTYEDSLGNPYDARFLLNFRDKTLPQIPK